MSGFSHDGTFGDFAFGLAMVFLIFAAICGMIALIPSDSDGTAPAAACEDMPVPKDCQARAEGIAQ